MKTENQAGTVHVLPRKQKLNRDMKEELHTQRRSAKIQGCKEAPQKVCYVESVQHKKGSKKAEWDPDNKGPYKPQLTAGSEEPLNDF